jgi:hypothetical protein
MIFEEVKRLTNKRPFHSYKSQGQGHSFAWKMLTVLTIHPFYTLPFTVEIQD